LRVVEPSQLREVVAFELQLGKRLLVLTHDVDALVDVAHERVSLWGLPQDLDELARQIYSILRSAEGGGFGLILITPAVEIGIGAAINDRLRRAGNVRE
jgi:hypothetical protein